MLLVVALSAVFLVVFLAAFFWLDQFTQILVGLQVANIAGDDLVLGAIRGFQISVSMTGLRVFLGGGAVFFEFLIIIMSLLDHVMDTIKALIRPLTVVVPLIAFLYSAYQTFDPIVRSLLPTEISGASTNLVEIVSQQQFNQKVLLTFATMLLFLLFSRLFISESAQIRALKAENQRLKRKSG